MDGPTIGRAKKMDGFVVPRSQLARNAAEDVQLRGTLAQETNAARQIKLRPELMMSDTTNTVGSLHRASHGSPNEHRLPVREQQSFLHA